jgi:hypothetical protein
MYLCGTTETMITYIKLSFLTELSQHFVSHAHELLNSMTENIFIW